MKRRFVIRAAAVWTGMALMAPGPSLGQEESGGRMTLPAWCAREFRRHGLHERLELHGAVRPAFQRGDFDGDGRIDCAFLVRDRRNEKVGLVILHRRGGPPYQFGAGVDFGRGGDDWRWLDLWSIAAGEKVARDAHGRDVLLVENSESASAYVYWDGAKYVWLQAGD